MTSKTLRSLLLAAPASASVLYATTYNDHGLYTLSFNGSALTPIATSYDCGTEPTWLTLDKAHSTLYCLNEGWEGVASITSYHTADDGKLTKLDLLGVTKSPVAATLFGPDNSQLAVAFYDTSSFETFSVGDPSELGVVQNQTYTLAGPGPVSDRQDAPHIHETVLDPTKKFIVATDLGSDLIHIYRTEAGSEVTELPSVKAVPGSGPRHAGFVKAGRQTYFYTVNELGNSITGYNVKYNGTESLDLTQLFTIPTHGPNTTVPAGTKAAELVVSPDQRFITISSRGESSLKIPNFDASNSTALPSDPLVTFSVNQRNGSLTLVQAAPAGGLNPRGFSFNKAGTLVASALQDDNRVVVIERDVKTGKLGKIVAHATVGVGSGNGPNYALFYE